MKALVLLSGGIDSTVCLAIALQKYKKEDITGIFFNYGQKNIKEIQSARNIASYYDIKFIEEDIQNIMKYAKKSSFLLEGSNNNIKDIEYKDGSLREKEYVPFRNGIMISILAVYADSLYKDEDTEIYIGIHDSISGRIYADNTVEFIESMNKAVNIASYKHISINNPLVKLYKKDVISKGLELKIPFELTWTCYTSNKKPCGKCGTCKSRLKAFMQNNITDPLEYEE